MNFIVISIWLAVTWLALDLWFKRDHKNHKEVTLDELLKAEGM